MGGCVAPETRGVSNMRLNDVGIARNERIAPEEGWPRVDAAPEPQMPFGQKMALLKLRKGELAAAILAKLAEMSAPEPAKTDWLALIEGRLIRRNFAQSPAGRLELTPPGLSAVGAVMRELAPKYGIHIFSRSGGRGTERGMVSRCSCLTFSAGPHMNTRGGDSRIRSSEHAHMCEVESGAWQKRQQSLVHFLNEVAPPRFDFAGPST